MSDILALSDVLVVRALERACSRGLDGSSRAALARRGVPKHHGYETILIPTSRHDRVLFDTWHIVGEIAERWAVPASPDEWAATLDSYCRDLLTSRQPHTLDLLELSLRPIGVGRVA